MAIQKRKINRKNRKRTISRSRKIVIAIGITAVVLVVLPLSCPQRRADRHRADLRQRPVLRLQSCL